MGSVIIHGILYSFRYLAVGFNQECLLHESNAIYL